MNPSPPSFTTHHFHFTVEVDRPIEMYAFKGSALRGAWQSHLRSLYCAQTEEADPLHQAMCPVCFLLSRETGSGGDRRPYAFMPPLTEQTRFEIGERFQFGVSLFGQAVQFMPYLVLAIGQMGQHQGLGKVIHPSRRLGVSADPSKGGGILKNRQRGTFRLISLHEVNPLTEENLCLLDEGQHLVQQPSLPITSTDIQNRSQALLQQLGPSNTLSLTFLTPMRLIQDGQLVHQPHFRPFMARLIDRLDALRQQYAAAKQLPKAERDHLLDLAQKVHLLQDETRWADIQGSSSRLKQRQNLGGFVGQAIYQAEPSVWADLLPRLLWGTVTQVGKHTVKGCGWYAIKSLNR